MMTTHMHTIGDRKFTHAHDGGDVAHSAVTHPEDAAMPDTKGAATKLKERADSYARDARKFRDAAALGKPIISRKDDAHWASLYGAVADELRKVASEL